MFYIENDRQNFWQWDINQRLVVADYTINVVHFSNKTDDYALKRMVYEEGGIRFVDVPNSLLQNCWTISVYAYDNNHTEYKETFDVIARSRPEDYIYTDDDIRTWEELNKRIDEIEENGISQERVSQAVAEYLDANPIETGATAEQAAQIEANKNAIAALEQTAATKQYVDDAIANVSAGGEVDLSAYALKTDIPTKVSAFTNDAGYLTQHQSLEAYALKSDIPSLDAYALKTEIPDVSNYQTAEQVNAAIVAYVGVIENGSY